MTHFDAHASRLLDSAVAEYLEALERGAVPDRDALLAGHPEVQTELLQFFADHDAMERSAALPAGEITAPLRQESTQPASFGALNAVLLPRRFGAFELLSEVARGGMGIVYRAKQANPQRIVALKMILAGQFATKADVDRFQAEAHAAAALDHPNIVPVFEVGQHAGHHYFTMGLVEGPSLAQRLLAGPLPARQAASILRDAARAADYAHGRGVIHRDLKPANIMLDADGRVRVTDFGLAKRQADQTGLTETGQLLGTPSYMSPEQIAGHVEEVTAVSDVYSLGATLYALLTGRPPFHAANLADTLRQVADQEPAAPRQLDAAIPRDLETITLKCLEKAPLRRYPSANDLADDLDRLLADQPIAARRPTPLERALRWRRCHPVAAALIIAATTFLLISYAGLAASNARIRAEASAREIALQEKSAALVEKDAALVTARKAVDQMLTRVGSEELADMPLAHPLRAALLGDAVKFYEGFLAQDPDNLEVRDLFANLLQELGYVQRELGKFDDACRSFQLAIENRQFVSRARPHSAEFLLKVARAQEAYAFTAWRGHDKTGPPDPRIEEDFRLTLATYASVEHQQPDQLQPVGLCLRCLAKLAFQRGNKADAERLFREAIDRSTAFVRQNPDNTDARCGLCWAYAELYERILIESPSRAAESEAALHQGLDQAAALLESRPQSMPARDIRSFLKLSLVRCYFRNGKIDAAMLLFRQAIGENQSLCIDFPYSEDYWNSTRYFYEQVVRNLLSADRPDDAKQVAREFAAWLREAGPKVPANKESQSMLQVCRNAAVALLHATGEHEEALALGKTVESDSAERPK